MPTINISNETYEAIKDQLNEDEKIDMSSINDMVDKSFFFRTVTYHLIGKVTKIMGNILMLEKASWIPDSGRFMQCIKEGKLGEVEPVGIAFINLNSLTDFFPWKHRLPTGQK